jgi:hypothetical protein
MDQERFRVIEPRAYRPNGAPAAAVAGHSINQNRHRAASAAATPSAAATRSAALPPIVLAAGERYTSLFYFVPTQKGIHALDFTLHWVRIHNGNPILTPIALPSSISGSSHSGSSSHDGANRSRRGSSSAATPLERVTENLQRELHKKSNPNGANGVIGADSASSADSIPISRKHFAVSASGANLHADVDEPHNQLDDGSLDHLTVAAEGFNAEFKLEIARLQVLSSPIQCNIICPPTLLQNAVFPLCLKLTNLSDKVQDLEISVDNDINGKLIVQGVKTANYRIFPMDSVELQWFCTGLDCGFIAFPRLFVKSLQSNQVVYETTEWGNLFVHPTK